jgi:hypothetical protein
MLQVKYSVVTLAMLGTLWMPDMYATKKYFFTITD